MPRVRRRGHQYRGTLTEQQFWTLALGGRDGFDSEEQYRQAWRANRDELLAGVNEGTRPAGWWELEFRGKRKPGESDLDVLHRCGLLRPEEKSLLVNWGLLKK
jgi:hypothetical protein